MALLAEWLGRAFSNLEPPDQIDGLHIDSDLMLIAALIDGEGRVLYYARRLAPTVEDGL